MGQSCLQIEPCQDLLCAVTPLDRFFHISGLERMGNLSSGNPKHFLRKIGTVRLLLPLCLPVPATTAQLVHGPAAKAVTETGREVKPPQEAYGQQPTKTSQKHLL